MSGILKSNELWIPGSVTLAYITWYNFFCLSVKTTHFQVDWKDTWEKYENFDFASNYAAIHDIKKWKIAHGDIFFKVKSPVPTSTPLSEVLFQVSWHASWLPESHMSDAQDIIEDLNRLNII